MKCILLNMLLLALHLSSTVVAAATADDYYRAARKAYEQKDYGAYVSNLEKVLEAGTSHPLIYLNLAQGNALLGKPDAAFGWLETIAGLGIAFPIEADAELQPLKASPRFQGALDRFRENLRPTEHSKLAFTIPDPKFIPEGVAYDRLERAFYVSSVLERKVVRIDRQGSVKDFITDRAELGSILGISVDPKRRRLWVAASSLAEIKAHTDPKPAGIWAFDLRTGALVTKHLLSDTVSSSAIDSAVANPARPHVLGDVVLDPQGHAFTSDSLTPDIYRAGAAGRLEKFIGGTELFRSPQGLCFSRDGKIMYVADYVRGLIGIEMDSKRSFKLAPPAGATLVGIDGLYFHAGELIATQNGVNPNRILRIGLDESGRAVSTVEVLESNHPKFKEITLGVVVGNDFYYVANSQLDTYLENPAAELQPPVILKLSLRPRFR